MMTKSIERAQKKVEENNFGVRKRLLEYDDVMNAQREVVYKRRKHALHGERLKVDIANMMFDTSELIVQNNKLANDFKNYEFDLIRIFSISAPITEAEFTKLTEREITGKTYKAVLAHYTEKNERSAHEAFPIIKNVYENNNGRYERIVVPFTDGIKSLNIVTNLEKAYQTEAKSLITDFEKNVTLAIIDEAWKKHLRKMDELKQSVQLAVHEQKDPLLIYKLEAFKLFKRMVDDVNKDVISFLFKADLPSQNPNNISEAKEVKQKENYTETKEEVLNTDEMAARSRQAASQNQAQEQQPQVTKTIVRETPKINRNDVVIIKHVLSGKTEEMKFKKAEPLLATGEWVLANE
jgi:preprotein translocase subunit SecA